MQKSYLTFSRHRSSHPQLTVHCLATRGDLPIRNATSWLFATLAPSLLEDLGKCSVWHRMVLRSWLDERSQITRREKIFPDLRLLIFSGAGLLIFIGRFRRAEPRPDFYGTVYHFYLFSKLAVARGDLNTNTPRNTLVADSEITGSEAQYQPSRIRRCQMLPVPR